MKVTWIVPDTYGFIIDELEHLASRRDGIRVLSGSPVPDGVRKRLSGVELHECPECAFLPAMLRCPPLKTLFRSEGLIGILRNPWHARKIAGIYKKLWELEQEAVSSVIHSHFAHPGGIGGSLLSDVPQLLTLRGYDILTTGSYGSLWNPFYRRNLTRSFSTRGIVTAGSSFSMLRARQILGPEADLRLLAEGIMAGSFALAGMHTRESLGIPQDGIVLMNVGNLIALKNQKMLLEALPKVLADSPKPVHLLVCGGGPLEGSLRALADELDISGQVHFMGRVARGELTDLYGLADLLVHCSLSEGFGNVILEAMLHELLVVASPVGVAPDVIRHRENGFLPMLGDKASFAESMLEAIDRLPAMKSELEGNRELVLKRFSIERRIDGYLALYAELTNLSANYS